MQFYESGEGKLPFSAATRNGNLIYTAGQVAEDPKTGEYVTGDFAKEVRTALDNVRRAIELAGGDMDHVMKVMVYLTDGSLWADYNTAYRDYFKADRLPARTTIIVAGLADPRLRIEIEAIAVVPQGQYIPLGA